MKRASEINDIDQFKLDDSGSYDGFADDYHNCVDKLSNPFVEHMVSVANIKPGHNVLDIGTGTGIVANCGAKKVGDTGFVTGIDLSDGMLNTSRDAAQKLGIKNVRYYRMDAENLAFQEESFDSVLSMCAMVHFPNPLNALNEMYRVLKPGGKIVVSIGCRIPPWGGGRLNSLCVGIKREIKQKFQPHLYAPGMILKLMQKHLAHLPAPPHSSWGGNDPGKNLNLLIKKTGFSVKKMYWLNNMIKINTVEEYWRSQTSIVTEVRKRLQVADKNLKESFLNEFKALSEKALSMGGNLFYCGAVFMVEGVKGESK